MNDTTQTTCTSFGVGMDVNDVAVYLHTCIHVRDGFGFEYLARRMFDFVRRVLLCTSLYACEELGG